MFDKHIKSRIHNYSVYFIDDLITTLSNEINPDVIIIDGIKIISEIKDCFKDGNLFIPIQAHETIKSYKGLTNIIEKLIKENFRKNHSS